MLSLGPSVGTRGEGCAQDLKVAQKASLQRPETERAHPLGPQGLRHGHSAQPQTVHAVMAVAMSRRRAGVALGCTLPLPSSRKMTSCSIKKSDWAGAKGQCGAVASGTLPGVVPSCACRDSM